jgi:DNA-binding response OmpR family regulator
MKGVKRILIVEDEENQYEMYKKLLSNHGYFVDVARDGEEGLRACMRQVYNLILLDLRMPVMDGMTMMRKLREEGGWKKAVPIIILTNLDASDERIVRVVKDQPAYYLVKASNPPEVVLEKVNEVLHSSEVVNV